MGNETTAVEVLALHWEEVAQKMRDRNLPASARELSSRAAELRAALRVDEANR